MNPFQITFNPETKDFVVPDRTTWPELTDPFAYKEAIAMLLLDDVISILGGKDAPTLYVNCNDVFYWACADGEALPFVGFGKEHNQATIDLYNMHRTVPRGFGSIKWACLRRKMRPQGPMEKYMREAGAWDDELEALQVREDEE